MAPYSDRSDRSFLTDVAGHIRPNIAFIVLILGALIAFEIFNYSTTDHALGDILGELSFAGIRWSTVLALAFCGIDFAGIARLFSPEQGSNETKEAWYLFAAWLMAATMNAVLTWWGVSMAVATHNVQSATVVDPQTMSNVIPVFVAVLVWLIRILIIGTLSMSLDRYVGATQAAVNQQPARAQSQPRQQPLPASPMTASAASGRPAAANGTAAKPRPGSHRPNFSQMSAQPREPQDLFEPFEEEPQQPMRGVHAEPSYHTLSMSARPKNMPSQGEYGDNGSPRTGGGTGGNTGPNRTRRM